MNDENEELSEYDKIRKCIFHAHELQECAVTVFATLTAAGYKQVDIDNGDTDAKKDKFVYKISALSLLDSLEEKAKELRQCIEEW